MLDRLPRAGGMFFGGGSGALGLCDVGFGRLIGYAEPQVNAWYCLGAVAVLNARRRVERLLVGKFHAERSPLPALGGLLARSAAIR